MFDIGFGEILIISLVALLVIGPERMPEAVRFVALRLARLKRGIAKLVSEVEREVGMDDIRRQIRNEDIMTKLKSPAEDIKRVIDDIGPDASKAQDPEADEKSKS